MKIIESVNKYPLISVT